MQLVKFYLTKTIKMNQKHSLSSQECERIRSDVENVLNFGILDSNLQPSFFNTAGIAAVEHTHKEDLSTQSNKEKRFPRPLNQAATALMFRWMQFEDLELKCVYFTALCAKNTCRLCNSAALIL